MMYIRNVSGDANSMSKLAFLALTGVAVGAVALWLLNKFTSLFSKGNEANEKLNDSLDKFDDAVGGGN